MLNDKSILITGGTGTLGKALTKHILENYNPRRLVVFSRDEIKQHELAQEFDHECLRFFIGDIRDKDRLKRAFQDVDMVLHCAALKHVNQAEYDCDEYIKTNVYGTQNVIDAAIDNEVEKVILVSTDKAVNPISLYGSTKLTAEKLFISANNLVGSRYTRFSVVRLGNIWGSRGSVVPYYKNLIKQGVHFLPVTDKGMTRFFITAEESAKFTIDCLLYLMKGGETFIPKMKSARITDIVDAFRKEPGIVGMRPGEKLHETMCPEELLNLTLEFQNHFVIKPTVKLVHDLDYTMSYTDYEKGEMETGQDAESEYNSMINKFLTVEEIRRMIEEAR